MGGKKDGKREAQRGMGLAGCVCCAKEGAKLFRSSKPL